MGQFQPNKHKSRKRLKFRIKCTLFFAVVVGLTLKLNLSVVPKDETWNTVHSQQLFRESISSQNAVQQQHLQEEILNNDEGTLDQNPLLDLLKYANVNLTEDEIRSMPHWNEVTDMFGVKPRIHGLKTCRRYRTLVKKPKRTLAPAGPFNSGTNLLFRLLRENCVVHHRRKRDRSGVDWQVNWGKHQSPRFRSTNFVHEKNNSNYLPIVVVRDPWTWFQSMCRHAYSAKWFHVQGPEGHCPNFVPNHVEREWFNKSREYVEDYFNHDKFLVRTVFQRAKFQLGMKAIPVEVRYKSELARHKSLAHFWKDWYQEYYDAKFPRIMVRLEDLVFYPYEVISSICSCVDGQAPERENFKVAVESTKATGNAAHARTQRTGLISSFSLHVRSNRTAGMTAKDIKFARKVLDRSVMPTFLYKHPK